MFKVRIGNEVKEFDENKVYFKRIKTVEEEFFTEISYCYMIGKIIDNKEKIYGDLEEFLVDEAVIKAIKKDYPKIETYEETQVFHG
ncbi:MAG: hypothetical protein ACRC0R_07090 [Cetobacterium sp.]